MKKLKKWERVQIKLKKQEIIQLKEMTAKGTQTARGFRRARMLLLMNEGKSGREAAKALGVVAETAYRVKRRYIVSGLEVALSDDPRPGKERLLTVQESQRIIAMVCGSPPEGRAVWSVRLIAEEAMKKKIVKQVGRETIRLLLQSHDLKPWREKNVVYRGADRGVR